MNLKNESCLPGSLSFQQVAFFRGTGYLKITDAIPPKFLQLALEQIQKGVENKETPFKTDRQGRIHRLDAIYQRNGAIRQLLTSKKILDVLESLLGPNIEFSLNRHNHATLNYKDATPVRLHRDILQWSRPVISVIFYLEESSLERGCTWLIPTSQYLPFVGTPNNGGTWMDEHSVYADLIDQSLPCPMSKGSALIFDSLAFHTVGPTQTDTTRISITAAYCSVDELDDTIDHHKRVLVRGKRIYRGNDGYHR